MPWWFWPLLQGTRSAVQNKSSGPSKPSFVGNLGVATIMYTFYSFTIFCICKLLPIPAFIPYVLVILFGWVVLKTFGGDGIIASILAIAIVWVGVVMIVGLPSISFEKERILTPEFVAFRKNDKWGIMNDKGEVVKKAQWQEVKYHDIGLIAVKKDGKYGILDMNFRLLSSYQWDSTSDSAQENDAIIVRKKGVDYLMYTNGHYRVR